MNTEQNARIIWDYFLKRKWTKQAIAGMLGNMEIESNIMPDIHEISGGGGYGLVQWTPGSRLVKWAQRNGLDYRDIYTQLKRIEYEITTDKPDDKQFFHPTMSFREFTQSQASPEYLAQIFVDHYERPSAAGRKLSARQLAARKWFNLLNHQTHTPMLPTNTHDAYYTVVAGDSLWKIAQKFNTTIEKLLQLNQFSSASITIYPGQRIVVSKKTTPQQPKSTPTPHSNERVEKEYAESGKFTANRSIAIRNEAKDTSSTVATLNSGESVNYDKVVITNKYVYISYISYSGTRRYVAIRTMNNGQRGQMWGVIV